MPWQSLHAIFDNGHAIVPRIQELYRERHLRGSLSANKPGIATVAPLGYRWMIRAVGDGEALDRRLCGCLGALLQRRARALALRACLRCGRLSKRLCEPVPLPGQLRMRLWQMAAHAAHAELQRLGQLGAKLARSALRQ